MNSEPKNEEAACRAALEFRDQRRGETGRIVDRPDQVERQRPAVEFIVETESGQCAVEHTRVESFPNQIYSQKRLADFINSLERELEGNLSTPGTYRLTLWQTGLDQMTNRQLSALQAELSAWVMRHAASLKPSPSARLESESIRNAAPPETPVRVRLYRSNRISARQFGVLFPVVDDLEDLRAERMITALKAKLPKLYEAKQGGRNSILVLESDDLALANQALIGDALIGALEQVGPLPDEVYLVETETKPWIVWVLKDGLHSYPDISGSGPFEFFP